MQIQAQQSQSNDRALTQIGARNSIDRISITSLRAAFFSLSTLWTFSHRQPRATGGTHQRTARAAQAGSGRAHQTASMERKENMTIKALVLSDRADEYTGKRGLVKQQIITVMDQSETGERLAQPIEYSLSEEEKAAHAGKLQDKVINLGIRELSIFGTKLRARGRIIGLA